MGLTAGPVPTRVDTAVKAGLLDLVDHAVERGWSHRRACQVLELNSVRGARSQHRRNAGARLDDGRPGRHQALHALLDWEREQIVGLFDEWGEIDRSHRKLAHRGSRLDRVHVSESTVLRVLQAENLVLPARPLRQPVAAKPWPEWVQFRPCQVWGHDFTTFARSGRDALAVMDLVSRKWLRTLVVPTGHGLSEHIAAIYTLALEDEGLLAEAERRLIAPNSDEQLPILLAVSDGGHRWCRAPPASGWPCTRWPCTSDGPAPPPIKPTWRACSATSRPNGPTSNESTTDAPRG